MRSMSSSSLWGVESLDIYDLVPFEGEVTRIVEGGDPDWVLYYSFEGGRDRHCPSC